MNAVDLLVENAQLRAEVETLRAELFIAPFIGIPRRIIALLLKHPEGLTAVQVHRSLRKVPIDQVRTQLCLLVRRGAIERIGSRKTSIVGRKSRVYRVLFNLPREERAAS